MSFFSRWQAPRNRPAKKYSRQARNRRRLEVELLEDRMVLDSGLGQISGLTDTAAERFITGLYYDLLYRVPRATEVASWVNGLNAGASLTSLAQSFTGSPEYQGNFVLDDYNNLLGRTATATEIATWVNAMQSGMSLQTVSSNFLASNEYYASQGGTNVGWLSGLYQDVLGRAADAGGLIGWTQALQAGESRLSVASAIVNCQEADARVVQSIYQQLLHRGADSGGLSTWTTALTHGLSIGAFVANIGGSLEYYNGQTTGLANTTALTANQSTVHFDFGSQTSPVQQGYLGVPLVNFTSARGYGWTNVINLGYRSRTSANALTGDFHWGHDATFDVNLPNGTYTVIATVGDAGARHTGMALWANGAAEGSGIDTVAGQFLALNFTVSVTSGQLGLEFASQGGTNPTFALDGLDIIPGTSPVANAGAPLTTDEGTALTFAGSESGGTAPFTYSWDFGDGTTASGSLTPSHTYAVDGSYTATLTVTDSLGLSGKANTTVTVNNPAPANISLALNSTSINENGSVTLNGSFTDPATPDTHKVTINWGDGSVKSTVNLAAGVLTFSSISHQYLDNPSGNATGSFTISVTVADEDSAQGSVSTSVQVNNVAPANVSLSPSATSINEGGSFSVSGSFTDPGTLDTHQVTVNWGDGSANSVVSLAAGVLTFNGISHTYLDNPAGQPTGSFTVAVAIVDKDGGQGSASTSIQVKNVPPTVNPGGPYSGSVNNAIAFSATVTDPSPTDTAAGFTYAWNLGDGTTSTAASPSHAYTATGTYTVSVTVTDKDGGATTATTTAVVTTAGVTLITNPNTVFSVPVVNKPGYLQSFTDPTFSTKITRIGGNAGTSFTAADGSKGTWSRDARHMYSKDQPWNSDGTLIAIENRADDGGTPDELFLDGNTYAVKYGTPSNLPYGGGGEERWVYRPGHANERLVAGWPGNTLYWFNVVTNQVTRSWNLPVSVEGIGSGEGNTSQDGRFVALVDTSGHMFVVDMDPQAPYASYPNQRIGPMYDLSSDGISWNIDWVSVSASGKYVVVEYNASGGDAERVFDVNPSTLALTPHAMPVSWPGQLGSAANGFIYSMGHGDLTQNPFNNNEDVMVGQEESGNAGKNISGIQTVNSNGIGGVVMVQLSNNAVVSLTDPGNGGTIASEAYPHHVSTRDTSRPGWAYVSYYNEPGKRYSDEVVAVKLDGTGSVERYGHFHSDFDNSSLSNAGQDSDYGYRSEAHPVPSPDGKRVIFASNWLYKGGGDGWIEDYVIDAR